MTVMTVQPIAMRFKGTAGDGALLRRGWWPQEALVEHAELAGRVEGLRGRTGRGHGLSGWLLCVLVQ